VINKQNTEVLFSNGKCFFVTVHADVLLSIDRFSQNIEIFPDRINKIFDYFVFWRTIFENAIENYSISCPSQINQHVATVVQSSSISLDMKNVK
jgi:hypothetical protein